MGMGDLRELLGHKEAQIVAVCDVDSDRTKNAQKTVEARYGKQSAGGTYKGCKMFGDYRELVTQDNIDAVCVVTPDHWHALPAIAAAKEGKDIFLQKPLTLTIAFDADSEIGPIIRRIAPATSRNLGDPPLAAVNRGDDAMTVRFYRKPTVDRRRRGTRLQVCLVDRNPSTIGGLARRKSEQKSQVTAACPLWKWRPDRRFGGGSVASADPQRDAFAARTVLRVSNARQSAPGTDLSRGVIGPLEFPMLCHSGPAF